MERGEKKGCEAPANAETTSLRCILTDGSRQQPAALDCIASMWLPFTNSH